MQQNAKSKEFIAEFKEEMKLARNKYLDGLAQCKRDL